MFLVIDPYEYTVEETFDPSIIDPESDIEVIKFENSHFYKFDFGTKTWVEKSGNYIFIWPYDRATEFVETYTEKDTEDFDPTIVRWSGSQFEWLAGDGTWVKVN